WWRSGVFTALIASGLFLILSALVRRFRGPNPLVDMPYLRQWNTILRGIGLFFFRFCLVTTIILVPQSLAIHGFDADQVGRAVIMGHFIAQREKLHSNLLGLHVQSGNWITDANIRQLTAGLLAKSSGLAAATGRAVGVIGGRLRLEAYTLSLIDGFYLVTWACVVALLLVALLRKSPLNYGDLSAVQQQLATRQEAKS